MIWKTEKMMVQMAKNLGKQMRSIQTTNSFRMTKTIEPKMNQE
jgi:hypothetical protein